MSSKTGVLIKDGEIQRHPNGSMIDICEFKNCRRPCEQGWVKCDKHRNLPAKWKCKSCGRFGVKAERGVVLCEYCKHPAWIV